MKIDFFNRFQPVTALPFVRDQTYLEVAPGMGLAPFVKCFWGSVEWLNRENNEVYVQRRVIPDVCMDLIFQIDERNKTMQAILLTLDDSPYISFLETGNDYTVFGVRFYFWALAGICRKSLTDFSNSALDYRIFFPDLERFLVENLFIDLDFNGKMNIMRIYLESKLGNALLSSDFLNGVDLILKNKGNTSIRDLAQEICISQRSLQRIFREYTGMPPKKIARLVRYQTLWRDLLLKPDFQIQDEISQLGFYDQSHLLNEFKQFHGIPVQKALSLARNVSHFSNTLL